MEQHKLRGYAIAVKGDIYPTAPVYTVYDLARAQSEVDLLNRVVHQGSGEETYSVIALLEDRGAVRLIELDLNLQSGTPIVQ